eukprot:TRINITY_DN2757_c0_g1_i1.p1 TRINITY_DN2757_c0_g1~~TRINITY_DN2757_c0_g1_i1.p1  ORF type:complete len:309 (-),score=63.89 TRINITY_DN2757_c0_g1_i1:470-1396(-)
MQNDNAIVEKIISDFNRKLRNPKIACATAAVEAMTEFIKHSSATTLHELNVQLNNVMNRLHSVQISSNGSNFSLQSGTELFICFVMHVASEVGHDFDLLKKQLIERGTYFCLNTREARPRIAKLAKNFINDNHCVLTIGFSRVVMELLIDRSKFASFSVLVPESRPKNNGNEFLEKAKIESGRRLDISLICDSAVAFVLNRVDCVIVGAEAVCESGGIINQVGTYQLALCCKQLNVPFYVAAESYKFLRSFPLSQQDVPQKGSMGLPFSETEKYLFDYTPPEFITLIFTDLGVLTPSGVSDQLVTLYT